jgi:hypothetical protein
VNTWALLETAHYFWLVFQTLPLVVYLEGPSLYGAGIPFVVSLLIFYRFPVFRFSHFFNQRTVKNNATESSTAFIQLLIGFFLASTVIGVYTHFWSSTGYHFFDAGIIFWPLVSFLERRFHPLWAYPLTFFAMLADDVWGAGQYGHWAGNFWFGVGGDGFHDGLFIGPMTALALSLLLAVPGWWLRHKQHRFFKDDPAFSSQ